MKPSVLLGAIGTVLLNGINAMPVDPTESPSSSPSATSIAEPQEAAALNGTALIAVAAVLATGAGCLLWGAVLDSSRPYDGDGRQWLGTLVFRDMQERIAPVLRFCGVKMRTATDGSHTFEAATESATAGAVGVFAPLKGQRA